MTCCALEPYQILLCESGYEQQYIVELRSCIDEAKTKEFNTKEELSFLNTRITRLGQAVFKEVTVLLNTLKVIKKRCADADAALAKE